MKRKLIFVVGPTASGKTAAAIDLALRCGGEVVSADSVAIYRGMDIGSAKPTLEEMRGVPHHMLSFVDPAVPYSVSEFKADALRCIAEIFDRGHQPIVCGGTGLYVNALLFPLDFTAVPANEAVRREWQAFCEAHGVHALHEELRRVDPVSAEEIHENNVRRVIRALEIYACTGKPKSAQRSLDQPADLPYEPVLAGVTWPRERLYARCNLRVDAMLQQGLLEEVRRLREGGLSDGAQSMQAIGYKEIAAYLRGEISLEQAKDDMQRNTRHLAKRQLTWFRANDKIRWFDLAGYADPSSFSRDLAEYSLGNSSHS
ncbi:MAG: tRNA (adenosine(37)-N6)-dimethylallyltransferase MiaA [Candidatus Spyradocola sp.]|jgi:tRNA dimethylallyltransferase